MTERLVVIGGDATGMSAASTAKRTRGEELEVVAFERGPYTSYSACGIPYWIGGDVEGPDGLVARSPDEHRSRGIDVRTGHEVQSIDPDAGTVTVRDLGAAGTSTVGYDHLVIATGARPVRPDLPGIDAEGVLGVTQLPDGAAVLDALAGGARRAVVVGGGYIGIEMAEALVRRDVSVVLVDQAPEPMTTLDADMGALVRAAMEKMGIDVRTCVPVSGFDVGADGRVRAVRTDDGEIPTDLVIMGIGVRPDARLGAEAGLAVGASGGLRTDRRQRVLDQDRIWAGGDCVEVYDRLARRHVPVALGTHANRHGRVIGRNIGGEHATFPGVLGTAVSKVCALEVGRTGLGEPAAAEAGFEPVAVTIESTTTAGYMPGAASITVKLLAERGSGRLLGGQIVGHGEGSAKRIDVVATAVWNAMTAAELADADLSYAPPFSPVFDAVSMAAGRLATAVRAAG